MDDSISSGRALSMGLSTHHISPRPPSHLLGINGNNPSITSQWSKLSPRVFRFMLQSVARDLVPDQGVAKCLRVPVPRARVDVLYAPASRSSCYANLVTCKSVWMCPVCSAKITERRRVELQQGLTPWITEGRSVALVTLTLSHSDDQPLSSVLGALKSSWDTMVKGRWWRTFSAQFGLVGTIRALEVTHGSNGWHPHLHVLCFFNARPGKLELSSTLKAQWSYQVGQAGAFASWANGVDVEITDEKIAAYVAKFGRWSAAHELTKSPSKRGRAGGSSPLQLLADCLAGDRQSGQLWTEYALAFKGKRQLTWSRGLRQLLGLVAPEKTDAELVDEVEADAVVLASLTWSDWLVVLGNDARAELLDIAATGDQAQVVSFLRSLGLNPYVESS